MMNITTEALMADPYTGTGFSGCVAGIIALLIFSGLAWWQKTYIMVFLALTAATDNYIHVTALVSVAAATYLILIQAYYHRDKAHLGKAPYARSRYLLGRSAGDCLICHEEVQDPMLLDCGHIFCASCLVAYMDGPRSCCAYCGQSPGAAHSLRLERIATVQLAFGIAQALDVVFRTWFGGMAGLISCNIGFRAPLLNLAFVGFSIYDHGIEYWWKGTNKIAKRREAREKLPESCRWTRDVRVQMEDGWDWQFLAFSMFVSVSWTLYPDLRDLFAKEGAERLKREADVQWQSVCMCGDQVVDGSHYSS